MVRSSRQSERKTFCEKFFDIVVPSASKALTEMFDELEDQAPDECRAWFRDYARPWVQDAENWREHFGAVAPKPSARKRRDPEPVGSIDGPGMRRVKELKKASRSHEESSDDRPKKRRDAESKNASRESSDDRPAKKRREDGPVMEKPARHESDSESDESSRRPAAKAKEIVAEKPVRHASDSESDDRLVKKRRDEVPAPVMSMEKPARHESDSESESSRRPAAKARAKETVARHESDSESESSRRPAAKARAKEDSKSKHRADDDPKKARAKPDEPHLRDADEVPRKLKPRNSDSESDARDARKSEPLPETDDSESDSETPYARPYESQGWNLKGNKK